MFHPRLRYACASGNPLGRRRHRLFRLARRSPVRPCGLLRKVRHDATRALFAARHGKVHRLGDRYYLPATRARCCGLIGSFNSVAMAGDAAIFPHTIGPQGKRRSPVHPKSPADNVLRDLTVI